MERIWLDEHLNIKKLDPNDDRDLFLVKELDKDPLISGEDGFLWPMGSIFMDTRYLFREGIYQAPYGIYRHEMPLGYIELSAILNLYQQQTVDISYALLEKERNKGYATKTLLEVTKKILLDPKNDIQKVLLFIDEKNIRSQKVALRAGFILDQTLDLENIYCKTKK